MRTSEAIDELVVVNVLRVSAIEDPKEALLFTIFEFITSTLPAKECRRVGCNALSTV